MAYTQTCIKCFNTFEGYNTKCSMCLALEANIKQNARNLEEQARADRKQHEREIIDRLNWERAEKFHNDNMRGSTSTSQVYHTPAPTNYNYNYNYNPKDNSTRSERWGKFLVEQVWMRIVIFSFIFFPMAIIPWFIYGVNSWTWFSLFCAIMIQFNWDQILGYDQQKLEEFLIEKVWLRIVISAFIFFCMAIIPWFIYGVNSWTWFSLVFAIVIHYDWDSVIDNWGNK